jgi:N-glycosylase/DNA lyase
MNFSNGECGSRSICFPVVDYNLSPTLASGQAFRWKQEADGWIGIVGQHWMRLRKQADFIEVETAAPVENWDWLKDYLQLGVDLDAVLASFPDDEPLRLAKISCRGLRLLRQDPWETLASFICSSTKQIVQIQQIISLLCESFGTRVETPPGYAAAFAFPSAMRIASCAENDLRGCKMGFRAPNLLKTARKITEGEINLEQLRTLELKEARAKLMDLPGVGRKIADCVLLFGYGFQAAFPIDVWVMKVLREFYFPRRRPSLKKLIHFSETHFGAYSGYAQQYLFHYVRTRDRQRSTPDTSR